MIDDEKTEVFSVELDTETYDALSEKAKQAGVALDDYCTAVLIDAIKTGEFEKVLSKHEYPVNCGAEH